LRGRRATKEDWIAVVEAAYRPADTEELWLKGVLEAAAPGLDEGFGCFGLFFDAVGKTLISTPIITMGDVPEGLEGMLRTAWAAGSRSIFARMSNPGAISARDLVHGLPGDRALFDRVVQPSRIVDFYGFFATDPSGTGCTLAAPLATVAKSSSRRTACWKRVAAHLAAGLRLMRQSTDVEAVLDDRGRVAHAEEVTKSKAVRNSLREAAVHLTRATSALRRRDPDGALAIWRALVAGRWSLVDHFDRDGRRYFLARRNDPSARGPDLLTRRERQVAGFAALGHSNKLIAYELGLSPSTIAAHLLVAAAKLGVRSRTALIQACAAMPPAKDEDP
jgi:DNA-binding NarL/FixJ family response regulator